MKKYIKKGLICLALGIVGSLLVASGAAYNSGVQGLIGLGFIFAALGLLLSSFSQ